MQQIKIIFFIFNIFILSSCNGTTSSSQENLSTPKKHIDTPKNQLALKKIEAYAEDDQNPTPTIQDYIDIGTTRVSTENINNINQIISSLSKEEVNSVRKINDLIIKITTPSKELSDEEVKEKEPKEKIIIEDAENRETKNWKLDKNHSDNSKINNIYSNVKKSRVIEFSSGNIYDKYSLNIPTQYSNLSTIRWDMQWHSQLHEISIIVETKKGTRTFSYLPKDTGSYEKNSKLILPLGSSADNGEWHTYTRDLQIDLHRYEPMNEIVKFKTIIFNGNGQIDNIKLYNKDHRINHIAHPIVVASPGIVLTFDDSLIDDWYAMKDTFREKGVHATFFCNNWQNLSSENIAKFRELQNDGHEIAVHTKDHLSTYDRKYSDSENKAQAYLNDQIIPAIEAMNQDNFEPNSFSYPYISGQPKHSDLIKEYLPHIREFFSVVKQIDNYEETTYKFSEIKKVLRGLKKSRNIGVFLAHRILPKSNPDTYQYRITTEKLIRIIDEVNRLGLKFYTLEEAHRVYIQE